MKSRLALTLLLVAGFMLSTTGATLAISGSSGHGSAATNQYIQPGNEGHHNERGTKGVSGKGGNENNTLNEERSPKSKSNRLPPPNSRQSSATAARSRSPASSRFRCWSSA